jgi:hypothetical protein
MLRTLPEVNVCARGLCLLVVATFLGCGGSSSTPRPPAQWVATDGQVMAPRYDATRFEYEGGDPRIMPVRASGAHDLRCPLDQVTARVLRSGRAESYVAEGCGQRAAYMIVRREPSVDIYDCVLTGIVPLAPPSGS